MTNLYPRTCMDCATVYGSKQAFYLHNKNNICARNSARALKRSLVENTVNENLGTINNNNTINNNTIIQNDQHKLVEQVKMLTKEVNRLKVEYHAGPLPAGGIYIIQTGMCFALDNNVYKIGSTGAGFSKRFSQYEKGAKEICFQLCDKFQSKESQLLGLFRDQFTQRKDFGTEFFEGDIVAMTKTFNKLLLEIETQSQ